MLQPDIATTAIAAVPATIAAWAALLAARRGRQNADAIADVGETADQVRHATNGQLEAKIRQAVMEVFAEHRGEVTEAVMAESVRHLLDAVIEAGPEHHRK